MRRVVIKGKNDVIVENIADPKPGHGELCIEIAYCGICGSDLHALKGSHPFIPLPVAPGHEFSGNVIAIGKGVTGFKIGDRVTCEPNLVCGECYNCKTGHYNICENLRVMGCQSVGAMADYFIEKKKKTIHIPDKLTLKNAVLVEPLAVGVHAVKKAGVLFGKNVVIIGAGTIGLMVLTCAIQAGAKHIIVADLSNKRLSFAKKIGATQIINAKKENIVKKIISEKPFEGFDVVFECVGSENSTRDAMEIVRKGGRIVVVGVFESEIKVRMADVQDREMEIVGTLMYIRRDITNAIDIIANGHLRTELFISKEYPLEEAKDAFIAALDTKNNLKVIFCINPE